MKPSGLPICLAVGEEDQKFRAIAEDLARVLPDSRIETVPDADHAVHIDNPTAFLDIARRFLAEVDARLQPPTLSAVSHPSTQIRRGPHDCH